MNTIKIAIPLANGRLTAHFGHCTSFALADADPRTGKIVNKTELTPPPHEPGVLPRWLAELGVQIIIAGGMGQRAQDLFLQRNIKVVTGAPSLDCEALIKQYFDGNLELGDNACSH